MAVCLGVPGKGPRDRRGAEAVRATPDRSVVARAYAAVEAHRPAAREVDFGRRLSLWLRLVWTQGWHFASQNATWRTTETAQR
jgi:hypothetical protein